MMKTIAIATMQIILACIFSQTAFSQATTKTTQAANNSPELKTYLIEREIPGAGKLTPEQLKGISIKSCAILKEMGPSIQWVQSYVAGNKIYCVYKATDEKLIRDHAQKGGFPANAITEVAAGISPATAN